MSSPLKKNIERFSGIGEKVREVRGSKSQGEFADIIGMAVPALSRLETKGKPPKLETLVKIADHAQLPLDWFLGREVTRQEMTPSTINEALTMVTRAREQLEKAEDYLHQLLSGKMQAETNGRPAKDQDVLGEPV